MPKIKIEKKAGRCYLYTRVSTEMQIEGYSLDAQKDLLMKEPKHRDMQVVKNFSDKGKSGKNSTGHPQFQEMMKRIENGNEDNVDYVCKHRKLIDGQRCTYKKQPPQDPINDEVIKIVQVAYRSPTFARSLYEQLNEELNENEIKDRLTELRAARNQYVARKDKLGEEIDNLDALASNYDMMYEDMSRRLRKLYDEIAQTDIMIEDTERALREQTNEQATMEAAYVELQQFSEILPTLTDAQKKGVMQAVLERVELYPERQENGRYVKAVKFQFPVLFEGETPTDWWYTEEHDERYFRVGE